MMTIREEFASYEKAVIPPAAGNIQRKETELAFYAGALITLKLVSQISEHNEETAVQMIATLGEEIDTFFENITTKRNTHG